MPSVEGGLPWIELLFLSELLNRRAGALVVRCLPLLDGQAHDTRVRLSVVLERNAVTVLEHEHAHDSEH